MTPQKSLDDQCVSNRLPKRISNKQRHISSSRQTDIDLASDYQLPSKIFQSKRKRNLLFFENITLDFFIKIEQLPNIWTFNPTNEGSLEDNDEDKNVSSLLNLQVPNKLHHHHHLHESSSKSSESDSSLSIQSPRSDTTDKTNNRSPKYRPRHSYFSSSQTRSSPNNNSTEFTSGDNLIGNYFTLFEPFKTISHYLDHRKLLGKNVVHLS